MLNRSVESELAPFCREYNIGILPFYPLASGFLTGKYRQGEPVPEGTRLAGNERAQNNTLTPKNFAMLSKLENFAAERGHPMVELAIAWLLGNPTVSSVIAGATKTEQVTANAKAADWQLTARGHEGDRRDPPQRRLRPLLSYLGLDLTASGRNQAPTPS